MTELVKFARHGDVGVITVDNPPVNALSPGVPEGLAASMRQALEDPEVRAVVIIGAGRTFIAGADIREFQKPDSAGRVRDTLLETLRVIEDSEKPVVMAIHGTAFGGGLETAMAGHYRVAAASAQVGQPEVNLGLIPGAGGTERLPRLAGIPKALEMCAFGAPVKAAEALALGIVDRIIEGDLLKGAITFAREIAAAPILRTRDRNSKLEISDSAIFDTARAQALQVKRGQTAPLAAIEAVEASTELSFDKGCEREGELFNDCLQSAQSRALIHAFFGERTVAKIRGIPKDTPLFEIQRAAIIGAGTMGGGIAMNYANSGIPVIVKETTQEALDRGIGVIRKNYEGSVKKGRFSQAVMDQRMALITPQLTYDGFEQADVITEAVFESTALKKQVFAELDKIAKADCILATNTSMLDVDEIASATSRPHMVIGLHFFSPANVMRLLEVVRGKATRDDVILTSMALAKRLGKTAVLARNSRGFIGNRMVEPYVRESHFLLEEGASVEEVNESLYDFGMAMGPLAMDDLAGLDVFWRIRQESKHLEKPGVRKPLVADLLYDMGRYGQKSSRGWSKYEGGRNMVPDPEVAELIEKTATAAGIERKHVTRQEILDRCVLALVNEGAKLLEEGVALRSVDIDVVYLAGYGFPAWRGGPMFYADTIGLKHCLKRIKEFEKRHGSDLWGPAPLLERLAAAGRTFQDLDREKESAAAG